MTFLLTRGPDVIDLAIADMDARAASSLAIVIAAGSALMIAQPWRITRAVYGIAAESIWPPQAGMDARDVLAVCREKIAGEIERGREGHWSHDGNRLVALRQAEAALLVLIGRETAR
jgi:hypothetical protein